jgi:tripartite ATP-independent transporter DctM subunit
MLRFGYNPRFAVGVVAGSSVLGMLIPPSLLLIVYAILTEQSVGDMFVAGFMPGITLAIAFSLGILAMARFFPTFVQSRTSGVESGRAEASLMSAGEMAINLVPIVVLFVLVIGGIYGGIFTAVESGAVGALGALILALAKRRLTWSTLWRVLVETGHITASIIILVMSAACIADAACQTDAARTDSGAQPSSCRRALIVIIIAWDLLIRSQSC